MKAINSLTLIQEIIKENLYVETIEQLNKDIKLVNIHKEFKSSIPPKELKSELDEFLIDLFTNIYDSYLNLLYRVDVSEKELQKIVSIQTIELMNEISFLILKREFQKVWLKRKYS